MSGARVGLAGGPGPAHELRALVWTPGCVLLCLPFSICTHVHIYTNIRIFPSQVGPATLQRSRVCVSASRRPFRGCIIFRGVNTVPPQPLVTHPDDSFVSFLFRFSISNAAATSILECIAMPHRFLWKRFPRCEFDLFKWRQLSTKARFPP